ncbi:MAG: DUF3299 domain-containing protein [Hyphomicrobiaceae bacterium]|nr:DUF3299 domain-containing protein [Hyphomicrobiaceae bacterium]
MQSRPVAIALAASLALALAAAPAPPALAAGPRALKWDDLVPAGPPKPLKPFFGARPAPAEGGRPADDPTAPADDRGWMSAPAAQSAGPAPVVTTLDGELVRIGGYVVPLDFEATKVKEFLLVPFVGACIHVPPPPANQIIYVKTAKAFEVKGSFDPVWVSGTISVSTTFTGLAEAGYTIEASSVELRDKP